MGPVSDDDTKVTRTAVEGPVESESQQSGASVAERIDLGADDWPEPGVAGAEEAGYGYGV
jgi:hypothetical protein